MLINKVVEVRAERGGKYKTVAKLAVTPINVSEPSSWMGVLDVQCQRYQETGNLRMCSAKYIG